MSVTGASWLDTRRAFDGVAGGYHQANVENPILRGMRRRVLREVTRAVPRGSHVLDLGCGPGTDDEVLGRAGYRVTAIDWSPEMVVQATARMGAAGLSERVSVHELGIHEIGIFPSASFDAICSNFGPFNCVADLPDAARRIAGAMRPGGWLIASVIGRVCPWELALYLSRGDTARATVRFARGFVSVPLDGGMVWTRYYSPREFDDIFRRAGFSRLRLRSLGLLVPPPYAEAFARRHRSLIRVLQCAEDVVARWPGIRQMGDHFLIVLRKD